MEIFAQIAGWTGTILFLVAYYLVTFKKLEPQSSAYQFINLFGAIFLGINVCYERAWPALALEVAWVVIAIVALTRKGK